MFRHASHRSVQLVLPLILVAGSGSMAAGEDAYLLRLLADYTSPAPVGVHLNSSAGGAVSGWSFGVCTITPTATPGSIALGSAFNGIVPDFHELTTTAGGWTASAVLSFSGSVTLPPAADHWLYTVEYFDPVEFVVEIDFCETLGNPPVPVAVASEGQTFSPVTEGAFVLVGGFVDPFLIYEFATEDLTYDRATGIGSIELLPRVLPALIPDDITTGFHMGGSIDPQLITLDAITPRGALAALHGGAGPDLFLVDIQPSGWTLDVTHDLTGIFTVSFYDLFQAIGIEISTVASSFSASECAVTPLEWSGPFSQNSVDFTIGNAPAYTVNGWLTIHPVDVDFLRGDCNSDSEVDIADAIDLLGALFAGGAPPQCERACDHNDDTGVDIADAVTLLSYLFSGGPALPPPSAACGTDPTTGSLTCLDPSCP